MSNSKCPRHPLLPRMRSPDHSPCQQAGQLRPARSIFHRLVRLLQARGAPPSWPGSLPPSPWLSRSRGHPTGLCTVYVISKRLLVSSAQYWCHVLSLPTALGWK